VRISIFDGAHGSKSTKLLKGYLFLSVLLAVLVLSVLLLSVLLLAVLILAVLLLAVLRNDALPGQI
jgi:hypothetical protein